MTIEEALDDMRQRSELNFEGLNKSFKSTKDKTRQIRKYLEDGTLPPEKMERQSLRMVIRKCVTDAIDGGKMAEKLSKIPCIHVAGTKGKGSTATFCETLLRHQGKKVGLYTSPHLVSPCERIRIDGKPISEDEFAKYYFEIAQDLDDQDLHPVWFTMYTMIAFKAFADHNVDVAVLEVGLGGRFCTTNAYPDYTGEDPDHVGRVCVVCALDYDHLDELGNEIESIAWHKTGVYRDHAVNISSNQKIWNAGEVCRQEAALYENSTYYESEPVPVGTVLGAAGDYQRENAGQAIYAVRAYMKKEVSYEKNPLSKEELDGLAAVNWPGRSQRAHHILTDGRKINVFIDGAHTPESINVCSEWMESMIETRKIKKLGILFTALGDRDAVPLLERLCDLEPAHIFLAPCRVNTTDPVSSQDAMKYPINEQIEKMAKLANELKELELCEASNHLSIQDALDAIPTDINDLLITGSMKLVGKFLSIRPDLLSDHHDIL